METALAGISAAPGVAMGPAIVLEQRRGAETRLVPNEMRPEEAKHAHSALTETAADLDAIGSRLRGEGRDVEADIVETGALMARDPVLVERVDVLIASGASSTAALRTAAEEMAATLEALDDAMLSQRADDVRSIGRRAALHAAGAEMRMRRGIVVATTLGPADVAELTVYATGIALAGGGVTSHAAIVARSLGVPMVIGVGEGILDIEDGEELVIDADSAVVVREPTTERRNAVREIADARHAAREIAIARREEPAVTRDGRLVRVLANASTVAELDEAFRQGAEGVGLLRSELLFLEASRWPTFDQQVAAMRPVLARLQGLTATVRLFDFGGDKTPPFLAGVLERGIEILLLHEEELRTHLRAVVEAGSGSHLRLLVPMVGCAEQMRVVRRLVDSDVQVGAMIETPQAAAAADDIARESDFLSLGTNDLTQLILGLDREQSRKAPVMDVRVLQAIAGTMRAAREANIVVDVCGEAASDPTAMKAMIGFGADELSVAPARVGQVKEWVRTLDYERCRVESERLLDQAGDAGDQRV